MEGVLRKFKRLIAVPAALLAAAVFVVLPSGAAHASTNVLEPDTAGPVTVGPSDGPHAVFSSDTIASGGRVSIEVVYINPTSHPVDGSVLFVTDATGTAPIVVESCHAYPGDECSYNNSQLTFEVLMHDIPANEMRSATVTIRANDDAPLGDYGIYVTSQTTELPTPDVREFTLHVVEGSSDLDLQLIATSHGDYSSTVDFIAIVTNNGPSDLQAARVTMLLPKKLTGSDTSACAYDSTARRYDCHIGALSVGDSTAIHFSAQVAFLTVGNFAVTGIISEGDPPDGNIVNDAASDGCFAITSLLLFC